MTDPSVEKDPWSVLDFLLDTAEHVLDGVGKLGAFLDVSSSWASDIYGVLTWLRANVAWEQTWRPRWEKAWAAFWKEINNGE